MSSLIYLAHMKISPIAMAAAERFLHEPSFSQLAAELAADLMAVCYERTGRTPDLVYRVVVADEYRDELKIVAQNMQSLLALYEIFPRSFNGMELDWYQSFEGEFRLLRDSGGNVVDAVAELYG